VVDDLLDLGLVVDREGLAAAARGAVVAQDSYADGVECAHGQAAHGFLAEQVHESQAHLARCGDGEGDGEDLAGGHAVGQQAGDAPRQGVGFPGAWAGEDEQRAGPMPDGGLLFGRQAVQQRRHLWAWCGPRLGVVHMVSR